MNQRGFANIILVVAIAMLVGAVGYFAFVKKSGLVTQQPTYSNVATSPDTKTSDTLNWKTYSYSQSGFSIKYPQNWSYMINYKGFDSCFRENGKNYPADDGSNLCAVGLAITNKADINSSKGILSNSDQIKSIVQGYQILKQLYTKDNMTVGGVSATIVSGIGQNVFFEQGDYHYFLRVPDYNASSVGQGYEFNTAFTGVRDVLDKMLKTVQFTNVKFSK